MPIAAPASGLDQLNADLRRALPWLPEGCQLFHYDVVNDRLIIPTATGVDLIIDMHEFWSIALGHTVTQTRRRAIELAVAKIEAFMKIHGRLLSE